MTNHPKIQLGPDNLYINDKPITDMTIEERIEQAKKVVGHENIGHKKFYIFSESELNALLMQVQDEQNRNDRHKSVEVLTDHVYSWQEQGKKLTDPEFLNQLQNKLHNAEKVYAYEEGG